MIYIIKESKVKIKWQNANRKRYESIGYEFTSYGDEFAVNVSDVPKRSEITITAVCDYCGKEKIMTISAYNSVTKDGDVKYRCRDCYHKQTALTYQDIINDFNATDYIIITPEDEYKNGYTRIKYMCSKHGEQEIRASNFHAGKRCPKCRLDNAHDRYAFTSDEVYEKIKSLGGVLLNKEDYINSEFKNLKILCPCCKTNIFITSLKHFRQHGGQSCEKCRNKESVGERRIRLWLESNNFKFIQEKWFPDCRDINPLPFDFYLPENNYIIEFDGKQHFEETHFFSYQNSKYDNSVTSYIQHHDSIKTEYCKSKNISLLRIPYTEINNIEEILKENLIA